MDDGARLSDAALAAAQRGNFVEAIAGFERAAQAHLLAGKLGDAFAAYSNLAMMKKLGGDLRGALAAIDRALALPKQTHETIAYMTRAGILDALDDPEAITAWMTVATQFDDLAGASFALAHCSGATLKHGKHRAWDSARQIVAEAANVGPSKLVGIVGGFGESAGPAGVPALAQAVLLLFFHQDAFNASTAPFWDLLVDRVPPRLKLVLCAFGLIVVMQKREPVLLSRANAVLDRVARAFGISVEDVLTSIERDPAMMSTLVPSLKALVPDGCWIVQLPS